MFDFFFDEFTFELCHGLFDFILRWCWPLKPRMLSYLQERWPIIEIILKHLINQILKLIWKFIWFMLNYVFDVLVCQIDFIYCRRLLIFLILRQSLTLRSSKPSNESSIWDLLEQRHKIGYYDGETFIYGKYDKENNHSKHRVHPLEKRAYQI